MPPTRFIIIRHGETEWNLVGRIQGHKDSPLTESGRAQAMAITARLQDIEFKALYSSDLGRAFSTAQYVSDQTGHDIQTDEHLREKNLGILEGLTEEEARKRYPEVFASLKDLEPDYAVPGGESYRQFSIRLISCLKDLMEKHHEDQIVAITHGGALSRLIRHTLGMPVVGANDYKVWNAALNVFAYDNGRWHLEIWGDLSHLTEARRTFA